MAASTNSAMMFIQVLQRNPRFRRLWLGRVVSAIGDYFYFLAVPILVNQLTGSTAAIGAAMIFTMALPQLLFSLPAGVIVDRWDRRQVMVTTDVLRAILVLGGLLARDAQTVWILYGVGFFTSVASQFFYPAQSALVPRLVAAEELMTANGLMQVTMTIAMLAGPALAGFMIGWLGADVAFIADSLSFLISAVAVWNVGAAPIEGQAEAQHSLRSLWDELVDGLRLAQGNSVLRGVVISMAVVHLGLGAINVLWVPLLDRHYGVGPEGMGAVDSIQGIGMALGAAAIGWLAARFSQVQIATVTLVIIGLMLGLMGIAPNFAFIMGFSFILGLALTPVEAVLVTLVQQVTPENALGRVFSSIGAAGTVSSLLSMGAAAWAAEWIGIRAVYLACGAIVVLSGFIFATVRVPAVQPAAELA
jgi:MFS family permease